MANDNGQSAKVETKEETKIVSNKSLSQLTTAERRARYEELYSRMGKSRLEVIGRPGKHYLWAPKDDEPELAKLDAMGYVIVREPHAAEVLAGKKQPVIKAAGLRADGTYTLGDVILTEVDEEVYEFIMLENDERQAQLVAAAKEDFVSEASKNDVPTFEVKRK